MALRKLPMEIFFFIIELLHIDYIFDLARTCRQFYNYILRSNTVARAILLQYRYSLEASDAFGDDKAGVPNAFARGLRRLAKRRAAVRSAEPYSISVVAKVDSFCFTKGVLCFAFDREALHIRNVNGSTTRELVIDIPSLLRSHVIEHSPSRANFTLSPVYYSDGVVSCLYTNMPVNKLIVLSTKTLEVLAVRGLPTLRGFVVRNDGDYLFYGVKTSEHFIRSRQWAFWRLDLRTRQWSTWDLVLWEFIGSEVNKDVCFEIVDGQLYCLTNNYSASTYRTNPNLINEWNSFYRLIRFPVNKADEDSLEEPPMRNLWRRDLSEGPNNRYWDRMQLAADQSSGKLFIIESRTERLHWCKEAASDGFSNNCYMKEVSFTPSWDTSLDRLPPIEATTDEPQFVTPSSSEGRKDDKTLYGISQVITPRLPKGEHIGSNQIPDTRDTSRSPLARAYHPSCETFMELVRLGPENHPGREYLGLRVQPKRALGSTQDSAADAEPGMVWPRDQVLPAELEADNLADMLWAEDQLEALDLTADDQSLVYAPRPGFGVDRRKPLVLISFDPARVRGRSKSKSQNRTTLRVSETEGRDATQFPSWARMAEARDLARLDFGL